MIVIINIIIYKYMLYKLKENLPTIEILLGSALYLYFVIESTFSIAVLWLIFIIYLWLLTSFVLHQYKFNTFVNIICFFGILLSITLFFMTGVEEIPYPEGALIFHIEGITKALLLFFISSTPLIITNKERTLFNKMTKKTENPKELIRLRVVEALQDDAYKGIVRIDSGNRMHIPSHTPCLGCINNTFLFIVNLHLY